jgi:hypothetical protein
MLVRLSSSARFPILLDISLELLVRVMYFEPERTKLSIFFTARE